MGLFGGGFQKPGPGVSKDEPQKKRFFLFFDILFRKFWKICQLNLMYVLFWIPAAVGVFAFVAGGPNLLSILLVLVSVVLLGPATAGATIVLRNYSREEHAFVFSDFKDGMLKNIKQGVIYSTLSAVALVLLVISLRFYSGAMGQSLLSSIPFVFVMASTFILLSMNLYMYTMIVTFDMPLFQMLKNAVIFSIVGLFTNIFTLIVLGALALLMVLFFPLSIFFIVAFVPVLMLFIATFNAYPRIKKFMIDPSLAQNAPEEEKPPEDAPVFSDLRILPKDNNEK